MELDKQKFDELYEEIKAKNSELISEINQALLNGMTEEAIQPLKEKRLQCSAELRLMRHLMCGMDSEFIMY